MKYLLVGVFSLFVATAVFADTRTITVSGEGEASAAPDVAYINFEVITDHDTVSKAMAKSKVATTNVFAVLKKNKIDAKDICTRSFRVSPKYKYVKDQEPQVVGHMVSTEIKVTVCDLDKAGDLLDDLTADGHASVVHGINFDVLDKRKVSDVARESAVKDALRKANLLSKATGAKLGKVLTITESGNSSPRPYNAVRALNESASHLHTQGEQQFRVSVNLVIALED